MSGLADTPPKTMSLWRCNVGGWALHFKNNPVFDIRFCGAGPPTKKQSVFDIPISTENRPCKKTIKNVKKQSVFDKNNQVLNIRICSPAAPDKKQSNIDIRRFSPPPQQKNNLFLTSRFRPKTAPAKKLPKTLKNNMFLIKKQSGFGHSDLQPQGVQQKTIKF